MGVGASGEKASECPPYPPPFSRPPLLPTAAQTFANPANTYPHSAGIRYWPTVGDTAQTRARETELCSIALSRGWSLNT